MKPALLFYCQHSVGLGHLMRSYALCEKLAERFRVVLLCGGELPEGIAPPEDVELIPLPPLGVSPGEGFGSGDPRLTTERRVGGPRGAHHEPRCGAVQPAVVLVELFPFGRAKFARELVPLLEAARAAGAFTACSVRDILVSSRDDQRAFDDRARALRRRAARRRARALRPALRAPRGDVPAEHAADRARPLHRASSPAARRRRRPSAASTSSSPPAAAASGRR